MASTAAAPPPLDERQWQRPEIPQWYLAEGPRQGFHWAGTYMHENMIHRYLAESDFFDFTSKNGLPIDQSQTDPGAWALTHNRRDFEQWLAQRDGVEYVIADGKTLDLSSDPPKDGIWVIRKQDRKRVGNKDELTTLGTYFLIRENMYQAPSVADIVGNRLLAATTSLSDFFEQASSLPTWSPTTGYSYLPTSGKQSSTNRADSPLPQSREGSVVPGADTQSLRSSSVQPNSQFVHSASGSGTHDGDSSDTRKILLALRNTMQYGDEFADENPLVGEPGHFSFTASTAAIKKRKADEEAAATKAREAAQAKLKATAVPAVLKAQKPRSPPAVMTEARSVKTREERRASKMGDKIKRKKSRGSALSPSTPVASTPSAGI